MMMMKIFLQQKMKKMTINIKINKEIKMSGTLMRMILNIKMLSYQKSMHNYQVTWIKTMEMNSKIRKVSKCYMLMNMVKRLIMIP